MAWGLLREPVFVSPSRKSQRQAHPGRTGGADLKGPSPGSSPEPGRSLASRVGPRSSWEGFSPSWKRVKPCTGSASLRDTQALQSHVVTVELEAQREAGVGGPQTHVELVLEAASTPGMSSDASGSSWVFSNMGLSSQ